jgi:hypothetical protein
MTIPTTLNDNHQKIMRATMKVHEALQNNSHPDLAAVRWVMKNFVNALMLFPTASVSFSTRIEGNALVALCFRNGPIENVHAGLEKLGNAQMKAINVRASRIMTGALALKEICTELGPDGIFFWQRGIIAYHDNFCSNWETSHKPPRSDGPNNLS